MERLIHYFPDLSDEQVEQFRLLGSLYEEWNEKINVISRKDIDQLYLRHVLHSMAIAKWISFPVASTVMDLGCGGGFPGIPLAILYPDVAFHLIDARAKKIKVVNDVIERIGLRNAKGKHGRAEELPGPFDFVVTRAVAPMPQLWSWISKSLQRGRSVDFSHGLIALKGGNIMPELELLPPGVDFQIRSVSTYFEEDFFEEKAMVFAYRS